MATTNLTDIRKAAKLPAKQAGGKTVAAFFEANKSAMAAVLPRHVTAERMLRIALSALRSTPKLMECTTESLMGAVMQCASLGLEPNTVLGHAYLIPFQNRRAGRVDVQLIIGYRGLVDLARRSGQIISLSANAVRERDEFRFAYGLDEELHHVPARGERGEIIAFYGVAKLRDSGHQFEVLWREQVDLIRDASQGYRNAKRTGKDHPWISSYEEMGRKTAIRRLAKYLPLSIEVATAAALDGATVESPQQDAAEIIQGTWEVEESEPDHPQAEEGRPAEPRPDEPDPEPTWPKQFADAETGEVGWIDSAGAYFDAERHAWSSKQERPSVTADGTFRARRGAKRQSAPADPPLPPTGTEPPPDDDPFGGVE